MAKRKPLAKYNTPIGVAKYPHLNKPDTRFDDDGVYKVDLIVPEDEAAELVEYLEGVRDELFDSLDAKKQKQYSKAPVCEPELDDAGDETGNVIFKTKLNAIGRNDKGDEWTNEPKLFDSFGRPVDRDEVQIWSGSKLIVAGVCRPYAMGSTKKVGVSLKCDGVQIIELVTGGNATAESFGFKPQGEGFAFENQEPTAENTSTDEDDGEDEDDF